MPNDRSKLVAYPLAILTLTFTACRVPATPPDPPPSDVTRIPIEFRVSVADLEKEVLRGVIQKFDPKAKPELPITLKVNARDLKEKAPEKSAAKDAPKPDAKVVVLPAPVQPGRPRLLRRPIGSRVIERAVIQPAIDNFAGILTELPSLDYRVELRSFKLAITGQTLTCEVGGHFHSDGKAPPARPGQRANPPVNVRGDIALKLTVTKELAWSDSGKLELKEGASQVQIDPDAKLAAFPRLDVARVMKQNGLTTLLNGMLDRQVMKLSVETMPDLARVGPKVKDTLPFVTLADITAYPLRSDGKDLYIPLTVGLVPSNRKSDDGVKIATMTGTPPEPKVRGRIVFDADGKPEVKLDPMK